MSIVDTRDGECRHMSDPMLTQDDKIHLQSSTSIRLIDVVPIGDRNMVYCMSYNYLMLMEKK